MCGFYGPPIRGGLDSVLSLENRIRIYDPPYQRDVDSMTPSIRGGLDSMNPHQRGSGFYDPPPLIGSPPGDN